MMTYLFINSLIGDNTLKSQNRETLKYYIQLVGDLTVAQLNHIILADWRTGE
jgi:hypothetical protein